MGLTDILWGIAIFASSLLYPAGWEMVKNRHFLPATLSFTAGALLLIGADVMWAMYTQMNLSSRLIVSGLVGALVLIGLAESIRYMTNTASPPANTSGSDHGTGPPTIGGHHNVTVEGNNSGVVAGTVNVFGSADSNATPDIIFPKFALFWVETDQTDVYDLGIFMKLFNADTRAYTVNGLAFASGSFDIIGRGSWYIKRLTIWPDHGQQIEDRYIKAGSEGYYKILIPMQTQLTPANGARSNSGPPPGLVLHAKWQFVFGKHQLDIAPEFTATAEAILSQKEWSDLGRPDSKIDMNNLPFQPLK